MGEHGVVKAMQCRQELAHIVRAAGGHLQQIHAGGENPALPGHHHRARIRGAKVFEALRQAFAERDVERIGFAVPDRDGCDAVLGFHVDHG